MARLSAMLSKLTFGKVAGFLRSSNEGDGCYWSTHAVVELSFTHSGKVLGDPLSLSNKGAPVTKLT